MYLVVKPAVKQANPVSGLPLWAFSTKRTSCSLQTDVFPSEAAHVKNEAITWKLRTQWKREQLWESHLYFSTGSSILIIPLTRGRVLFTVMSSIWAKAKSFYPPEVPDRKQKSSFKTENTVNIVFVTFSAVWTWTVSVPWSDNRYPPKWLISLFWQSRVVFLMEVSLLQLLGQSKAVLSEQRSGVLPVAACTDLTRRSRSSTSKVPGFLWLRCSNCFSRALWSTVRPAGQIRHTFTDWAVSYSQRASAVYQDTIHTVCSREPETSQLHVQCEIACGVVSCSCV